MGLPLAMLVVFVLSLFGSPFSKPVLKMLLLVLWLSLGMGVTSAIGGCIFRRAIVKGKRHVSGIAFLCYASGAALYLPVVGGMAFCIGILMGNDGVGPEKLWSILKQVFDVALMGMVGATVVSPVGYPWACLMVSLLREKFGPAPWDTGEDLTIYMVSTEAQ